MLPLSVTFTSSDPHSLPLPSPQLLSLDTMCAQIAQLSGVTKYLEDLDRKIEDNGVLASDGEFAELLRHAMFSRRRNLVQS